MSKRRLVALLDKRMARRLIIAPVAILIAVLGLLLSPLLLLGATLADLANKRPRLPRARLGMLLLGAMVIESIGMLVAFAIWVLTGFGRLGPERWRWHMHRGFMGAYTTTMLGLVTRVIGTRIEWRDHADLSAGPIVLLARHTSFFDALIPATVLCRRNNLLAHHIVTQGMRYSPCIDIVGHRLPNRFITHNPGEGSAELSHIQAVGEVIDDRSAAIIFPEGTFRNAERFARVVRRLGRRQPELAARAQDLKHVLPPRANGIYALLQGAPSADVVVCTNTGFEPFGTIKQIVDRPYSDEPIIVETWRIDRAEIPQDASAFGEWLFDQYLRIDDWVSAMAAEKQLED